MIMIFLAQVKKSNECGSVSSNEIFNVNFDFFFFEYVQLQSCQNISHYYHSHHILCNPMSYYWFILIKIYYVCPILYFKQLFFFFLSKQHQIFLYFSKLLKGWVGIKNPDQLCFFLVPDSIAPLLPQITPLPGYIFPV